MGAPAPAQASALLQLPPPNHVIESAWLECASNASEGGSARGLIGADVVAARATRAKLK